MYWSLTSKTKRQYIVKANSLKEAVDKYEARRTLNQTLQPLIVAQPSTFTEESLIK